MDYMSLMQMFGGGEQYGPGMNFSPEQYGPGMSEYLKGTNQTLTDIPQGGNPMAMLSLMSMMKPQQQQAQIGSQSLRGIPGRMQPTNVSEGSAYTQMQQINPYATAQQPRRMQMPLGLMKFLGR